MKKTLLLSLKFIFIFSTFLFSQEKVTYDDYFPNLTFQYPVEIQNASDGSNRLFVVEQQGVIKVFENNSNTRNAEVFLDVTDIVSFSSGQEIGLLGLAFHPNYKSNGTFFIYHTKRSSVANVGVEIVLAKYTVDQANRNRANKNSRVEIFSFDKNQSTSNHNGGKIGFGPDGYLYISVGDGGGGGDPMRNAQNLNTIFGSILRIDIDLDNSNPKESNPDLPNGNYEIPRDNPRVGLSGLDELYAWGIRNTWKFSFDKGIMWGADVGQDRAEEINHIVKGGNYGWNRFEGNSGYSSSSSLVTNPETKPIFEYDHKNGDLSITGGYVYNGKSSNPLLKGKYIYADYVSGRVWSLDYNRSSDTSKSTLLFRTNGEYVSSFGLDESGEMYFSGYGTAAKIYKLSGGEEITEPTPNPTPTQTVGVGYWNEINDGTNGFINCVAENGEDIYIGGLFSIAGNEAASNFAVYNKTTGWKSSNVQVNGEVKTIAIAANGHVVIGGSFSQVNDVSANNIAISNGSSWSPLGSGTNGAVAKIAIASDNTIYAGGAFTTVNNILVNNIAAWKDNVWEALKEPSSSVPGLNNEVREITIDDNGTIYIGGNFDASGTKSTPRIATWNGSIWGTLGNGTSGFVEAITIDGSYVYAGGNFNLASGKTVNRIARWNKATSQWETLGNGLSGSVSSIELDEDNVYVGGNFVFASNAVSESIIVNNVARWNKTNGWQPLGEDLQVGSNNVINSILLDDALNELFVVGSFTDVGGINSNNIAKWSENYLCTNKITQEYQLDGVWESGQEFLEIKEGTKVVLSILPNNEKFSIKLPNGTEVSGDYSLGNVSKVDEGIYTFTTEKGCSAKLDLKVIENTDCATIPISPEYKLENADWTVFLESGLIIAEGSLVSLRLPNGTENYTIKSPEGTVTNGEINLKSLSAGNYTFTTENGCEQIIEVKFCSESSLLPEFKIGGGDWISNETRLVVDEGSDITFGLPLEIQSYTITAPNGIVNEGVLSLTEIEKGDEGIYLFENSTGCTATFNLEVILSSSTPCIDNLGNENEFLQLPTGVYNEALLKAEGNNADSNSADCALQISSDIVANPWEKYMIEINLKELGINAGDRLRFSLDGKSIDGNARIEVVQNNRPNSWEIGHTFTKEWTTFSQTITVPDNITTLDIWLFSNYAKVVGGTVLYDNLIVEKVTNEEDSICNNSLENINDDISLIGPSLQAGLDFTEGVNIQESKVGCALQLTNINQNQPWSRYKLSVNLIDNGLKSGDRITVGIDGKTVAGNARIEVVYNDRPNSWDLGHTFTKGWTNYSQTITIPVNTRTLDLWLFTNYNSSSTGVAQFANLSIMKESSQTLTPLMASYNEYGTIEITSDVEIFPNPTTDLVTVDITKFGDQPLDIFIMSSSNSLILEQKLDAKHGNFESFDFSQLPNGVYIIVLKKSNGERLSKKVIKR